MRHWENLVSLHRILADSRSYLPKDELMRKLDFRSDAKFYRLVNTLRNYFNAPLVYSTKYKGYKYQPENENEPFELPGLWFKTEELEALICLESIAAGFQNGYLNEAFCSFRKRVERLLNAQKITIKAWHERFKMAPIAYRKTDEKIFRIVSEAVLHGKQLLITYQKVQNSQPENRTVSPQTLLRYRDNWYLDTWCHKSESLRTFAVNRILNAEFNGKDAKRVPREILDKEYSDSYGIFSGTPDNYAEILFTGYAACEVAREEWHPRQQGQLNNDNTFLLKIPYSHSRELIMDILRWGEEAVVINPPALKKEISEIIGKMKKNYEK